MELIKYDKKDLLSELRMDPYKHNFRKEKLTRVFNV